MRFDILTIFPNFFAGPLDHGILGRAIASGAVEVATHDLRAFTHDRHRTVDDRPFGGGEGMVLKPEPLGEALGALAIVAKASRTALPAGAEAPDYPAAFAARLKSCPDTEHSGIGAEGGPGMGAEASSSAASLAPE